MTAVPLFRSAAGIQHMWEDVGGGKYAIHSFQAGQSVEDVLDNNKAMANHNDGWSQGGGRVMRRAASIPPIIVLKWLNEEGWNVYDPNHEDKLKQKLNDPDWKWLRTADYRV